MTEPSSPHPLAELTKARLREFVREKGILFWVFAFPLLMAIGLGVAFRERPAEPPSVAVVGGEDVPAMRALLESKDLDAKRFDKKQAMRALSRNKVDLVVEWGSNRAVMRYDAMAEGAPLARAVASDVMQRAAGRRDPVRVAARPEKRPGARYVDFLIPGLIGMNVMGTSMWGVGYNLVVARKRRLLRRYAVTPMRRSHFLLSYFISRSTFLVVELAVLIAFGWLMFGTKVQGSITGVLLVGLLGAAAFAAISLIIGARVENTESANGWMNFVQLPMWVLSGGFFSYERFPEALHEPIRWLPLTALCDALRVVYSGEATFRTLGHEVIVLVAWSVLGFMIAARTFRWQ